MRRALRKLALRLAALLAVEEVAPTRGVRLQAGEKPPQLSDPVVPAVGAAAAAVDVWPSLAIGIEWHDAPVRAPRSGGSGGVYL
jgi:hypothetical protein